MPAGNRRLAQWRVTWLIEHSTSHQLLCYVDSFVLRNPLLRKAANRYTQFVLISFCPRSNDLMIKGHSKIRHRLTACA